GVITWQSGVSSPTPCGGVTLMGDPSVKVVVRNPRMVEAAGIRTPHRRRSVSVRPLDDAPEERHCAHPGTVTRPEDTMGPFEFVTQPARDARPLAWVRSRSGHAVGRAGPDSPEPAHTSSDRSDSVHGVRAFVSKGVR